VKYSSREMRDAETCRGDMTIIKYACMFVCIYKYMYYVRIKGAFVGVTTEQFNTLVTFTLPAFYSTVSFCTSKLEKHEIWESVCKIHEFAPLKCKVFFNVWWSGSQSRNVYILSRRAVEDTLQVSRWRYAVPTSISRSGFCCLVSNVIEIRFLDCH